MIQGHPLHSAPTSRARGGFSTVETIAATGLVLMTIGSVFSVQQAHLKAFAAQSVYADSQTVTRRSIDLMTRELRMAGYNPTGGAIPLHTDAGCTTIAKAFLTATPSSVRFQQDLDGNGTIGAAGEDVTYNLTSNQITRTDASTNTTTPIVDNVPSGGLTFQYFNNSNPPVELVPTGTPPALTGCNLANIAKVRVKVTANLANPFHNNASSTPLVSKAESEVAIRNRALINF
jgi:type IV pilus assembly protein PilW